MPEESIAEVPRIQLQMLRYFRTFVRSYLRRHFHVLAANCHALNSAAIDPEDALVVYANHASWWDPLTAIYLAERLFPGMRMYAPIDADALEKYRMFGRLGFFPVKQNSARGAADFLKTSRRILALPGSMLWLTPEGRFADVRDTAAPFMPGIAHLLRQQIRVRARPSELSGSELDASRAMEPLPRVWFIPGAVEYTFWEESKPELLVWFGEPLGVEVSQAIEVTECLAAGGGLPGIDACELELRRRLREAQVELAQAAIQRQVEAFEVLLGGSSGSFFLYDWWRRTFGWVSGRTVRTEHGTKFGN